MDQPPNFRRRRIAFATAAIALLAFSNRPDPAPVIGVVAIAMDHGERPTVTAEVMPVMTGVAVLSHWTIEQLTR